MRRSPLLSRPRTALPKLSKLVCANAGSAVTSDVSATRLAIESARDAFRWRGVIASTRLVTWVRRASAGPPKDARFIGFLLLRRAVLAHIPPSRTRPMLAAVVRALPLAALLGTCFPRPARRAAQRSEEHTSELQSLMRLTYSVYCVNRKT